MDWNQVYTIVGANILLMMACLGTTVTLFLWARSEAGKDRQIVNDDRRDIMKLIREVQNEVKDMKMEFHGRLERQDAEFKAHILEGKKR